MKTSIYIKLKTRNSIDFKSPQRKVEKTEDPEELGDIHLEAWGDTMREQLDPTTLMKARRQAMIYIRGKKVWRRMKRSETQARAWEIIKTNGWTLTKATRKHLI